MTLTAALAIVWTHFVADFILQSDKVSRAKSSDNVVLAYHVMLYSLPLIPLAWFLLPAGSIALFVGANVGLHFVTDYVSSRMTTRLWKAGEVHWFFVVIGVDQALHYTALFGTYVWLAR